MTDEIKNAFPEFVPYSEGFFAAIADEDEEDEDEDLEDEDLEDDEDEEEDEEDDEYEDDDDEEEDDELEDDDDTVKARNTSAASAARRR